MSVALRASDYDRYRFETVEVPKEIEMNIQHFGYCKKRGICAYTHGKFVVHDMKSHVQIHHLYERIFKKRDFKHICNL